MVLGVRHLVRHLRHRDRHAEVPSRGRRTLGPVRVDAVAAIDEHSRKEGGRRPPLLGLRHVISRVTVAVSP
jgi:hypothetical protein